MHAGIVGSIVLEALRLGWLLIVRGGWRKANIFSNKEIILLLTLTMALAYAGSLFFITILKLIVSAP